MKLFIYYLVLCTIFFSCSEKNADIPVQTEDFCSKIHRTDKVSLTDEISDFDSLINKKTGVFVLEDGGNAMITRAWLSEHAEKSIDIQYFIFSTDNVGLIACDYLVRAANRGIKVRILVDDIMVEASINDLLKLATHENIDIKIYNPGMNLGKNVFNKLSKLATDFRSANQRMHNKTFIVDDNVVITGGRNIADEYFDYDHEYNFRDRDVLLIGKSVNQVNSSFSDFWNNELSINVLELAGDNELNTQPDRFDNLHKYACNPDNFWPQVRDKIDNFHNVINNIKLSEDLVWVDSVQFISDAPGKNDGLDGIKGGGISTSALAKLVINAKTSIDIETPYLITTDEIQQLFKEAIDRGVKIRILTNSLASTDNVEAFSAYQKCRNELLETGVQIFEFKPDAAIRTKILTGELQKELDFKPKFGLHAKTMVVDGEITVIGTFNLDPRSANLNTECITIIPSERISKNVLSNILENYKPENSWETTLDFNPDGEVAISKQIKTWTRKALPKGIL